MEKNNNQSPEQTIDKCLGKLAVINFHFFYVIKNERSKGYNPEILLGLQTISREMKADLTDVKNALQGVKK